MQDGLFTVLVRGLDENGQPVKEYRTVECVQREIDPGSAYADYLALASNPDVRFVVSNTTEAGIATTTATALRRAMRRRAVPAKLTQFCSRATRPSTPAQDKGLVLLPCELIDQNGPALKDAVLHFARLWQLAAGFARWVEDACTFCSTLVDRIVTGYPAADEAAIQAELGYADPFLVAAEYYYLFVIQGPAWVGEELKLAGAA